MSPTLDTLTDLYGDTKSCAKLIGLSYIQSDTPGLTRTRRGKGFTYISEDDQVISDSKLKKRIAELVIPPAWQEVWICPDADGHVLATGIDEKGRKQYIYHPKWRTMRDLIKFYRMIVFAKALPKIRRSIRSNLGQDGFSRDQIMAVMLWLLDNAYLRVGNDTYYEQNETIGLTTLTDKNVIIAGPVVTLAFKGKSGKDHVLTFDDKRIADIISNLAARRGSRLFRYESESGLAPIEAEDINAFLQDLTAVSISAKDFRTWGGTLMAFNHFVETHRDDKKTKPQKVVIEAVDAAANILGNTRSVARSSYVHPDILTVYVEQDFDKYYSKARRSRPRPGLTKRETELVSVLEQLFDSEFELLQS